MKIKILLKIIFVFFITLLTACTTGVPSTTSSSPTTSPPIVGTIGVPGVEILAVALDRTQENPGGPVVAIELKNITPDAIISVDVKLYEPNVPHGSPWTFDFSVSQSSLFVPGVTIGSKMTLINGGWGTGRPYFVTIAGTYSNGTTFSFRWSPPGDGDFNSVSPPPDISKPPVTTPPPSFFPTVTVSIDRLTVTAEDMGASNFNSSRLLLASVSVSKGETITLTLFSLSKSYPAIWSAILDGSGIVEQEGQAEFFPYVTPNAPGAGPIPGNEKWTFKAMSIGKTTIVMTFRSRAQLPDEPTLVTLELMVTVK